MREPKNQMLGTMEPPLMQLSVKVILHPPDKFVTIFAFFSKNNTLVTKVMRLLEANDKNNFLFRSFFDSSYFAKYLPSIWVEQTKVRMMIMIHNES